MTALGAGVVSRAGAALLPEAPSMDKASTQAPLPPPNGRPYNPVVTLNGWTLPWRMRDGVKEFHLIAEPVTREIAPGMKAHLWGYNGQSPGPTIEVVEGDRVRIFVTNKLPEHTSIHWHGQRLPNGMDGVTGLTQPGIQPGKTFVYEFIAKRPGTFMYHPHADEMVQMAMGMMGFWVTHPKDPSMHRVDRDFVFLMNAYDIDPGSYTPKVNTMLDFNLWTFNSRVFPGIDAMMTGQGPFGGLEMGGMFTTVKVRKGLARDNYADPGWYPHPHGTVAYEWKDAEPEMPAAPSAPGAGGKPGETMLEIRKRRSRHGH